VAPGTGGISAEVSRSQAMHMRMTWQTLRERVSCIQGGCGMARRPPRGKDMQTRVVGFVEIDQVQLDPKPQTRHLRSVVTFESVIDR
jgi:hypothetical protein